MMESKKVHIICLRFSSLGDVLLQSSFFSMLKKEYGQEAKVTVMTASEFAPLFEKHPHVDDILSFSRDLGLRAFLQVFKDYHRRHKVDFIFDLHNTLRANFLKLRFFYIPKISVDKRKFERKLLISKLKINLLSKKNIMERVLEDFNFLWKSPYRRSELSHYIYGKTKHQGISSLPNSFYPQLSDESLQKFNLKKKQYMVFIPAAAHENKRWSEQSFKELAQKIMAKNWGVPIVILAGPDDHFCQEFNSLSSDHMINLQGKTTFKEAADIAGQGVLCIGNDTGLIHLAEAQGCPCVMIMGPTSDYFGFSPHLKTSYLFSHDLFCRPCSGTGAGSCHRDQKYCLNLTQPQAVFEKVQEVLEC